MRLSADTAEAVMSEGGPGAECDLEPVTSGPAPECKQPHCARIIAKLTRSDKMWSVKMWIKLEFISHTITIIITTRQIPPFLDTQKNIILIQISGSFQANYDLQIKIK